MLVEEIRADGKVQPLRQPGALPEDPAEHELVEERPVVRDQEDARVGRQPLNSLEPAVDQPARDDAAHERHDEISLPDIPQPRLVAGAHRPEGEPLEPAQHFEGRTFHARVLYP